MDVQRRRSATTGRLATGALAIAAVAVLVVTSAMPVGATGGRRLLVDRKGSAPWRSIGAALRAARAGDTIVVAAGTYVESLVVRRAVRIEAAPGAMPVVEGRADRVTLKLQASATITGLRLRRSATTGTSAADDDRAGADVVHVGAGSPTLVSLVIEGMGAVGIDVVGAGRDPVIRDATIDGAAVGIRFGQGAGGTVAGGRITGSTDAAILATDTGTAPSITGVAVAGGDDGIVAAWGAAPIIEGNTVVGVAGVPIWLSESEAEVRDNDVVDPGYGIQVDEGGTPRVEGNRISGSPKAAIFIEDAGTAPAILDNTITGGGWGIEVHDGAAGTVQGNQVTGCEGTALVIDGVGTDPMVRANTFDGCAWSVLVSGGAEGELMDNTIGGWGSGGLWVEGVETAPTILGNTIAGIGSAISVADRAAPLISSNTISVTESGIGIDVQGRLTAGRIAGNRIDGDGTGILLRLGARSTLEDNDVRVTSAGVIVSGSGTDVTLRGDRITGAPVGVWVGEGARPSLTGVSVTDATQIGIGFTGADTAGEVRDPVVVNALVALWVGEGAQPVISGARITGGGDAGLALFGTGSDARVDDVSIIGGDRGIVIAEGAAPTITRARVRGVTATGIELEGAGDGSGLSSVLVLGGPTGIRIAGGGRVSLHDVRVMGGGTGVEVVGGTTTPSIIGAVLVGQQVGLRVASGGGGRVRDLRVIDAHVTGVEISGTRTAPRMERLTIAGARTAVDIAGGASPRILGVHVSAADLYGLAIHDAATRPVVYDIAIAGAAVGTIVWAGARPAIGGLRVAGTNERVAWRWPSIVDEAPLLIAKVAAVRDLAPMAPITTRGIERPEAIIERAGMPLGMTPGTDDSAEVRMLQRIGLLPDDFDAAAFQRQLARALPSGWLDPTLQRITVVDAVREVDERDRGALVFQADRAITAQHHATAPVGGRDAQLAAAALADGDATMVLVAWQLGQGSLPSVGTGILPESDALAGMPPILARELTFSSTDGLAFVATTWGPWGWPAVEAMWSRPPVSTEQVLHPRRYPDHLPVPVMVDAHVARPAAGWTLDHRTTMGELRLGVWVADGAPWHPEPAFVPQRGPGADAAEGWGGDELLSLTGPDGTWAVVWQTAWDTPEDATEFIDAATGAMTDLPGAQRVTRLDLAGGLDHPVLIVMADGPESLALLDAVILATIARAG